MEDVAVIFKPPTERNWDTYDAEPTTQAAIDVVKALAIVPTVNGGVQIELHAGGHEVEIEYDAEGRLESALISPAR